MCKQKITCSNQTLTEISMMRRHQHGFSLIMVLAIMVVIALMVIAGSQVFNSELRISANDADRKHAFSLAEKALLQGEYVAAQLAVNSKGEPLPTTAVVVKFTATCMGGRCLPSDGTPGRTEPAWERTNILTGKKDEGSKDNSVETTLTGGSKNPRYIIEYLGDNAVDGRLFRVTSRAWGANENTVVTVQSYIATPLPLPEP